MVRFTLMFALSVYFTFRSNALISCLGQNFPPRGKIPADFEEVREKAACRLLRSFLRNTPKFCRRQNAARQDTFLP